MGVAKHTIKLIGGVLLLAVSVLWISTAKAAHSDSLFVYDFRNATSSVANQAATKWKLVVDK